MLLASCKPAYMSEYPATFIWITVPYVLAYVLGCLPVACIVLSRFGLPETANLGPPAA
jgi:hypothetical protein